jgi:hypothetical protein
MEIGKIYFITTTIFKWIQILHNEDFVLSGGNT